ncbi:hypothetical protein MY4824_005907 [Beauveria thailandica]
MGAGGVEWERSPIVRPLKFRVIVASQFQLEANAVLRLGTWWLFSSGGFPYAYLGQFERYEAEESKYKVGMRATSDNFQESRYFELMQTSNQSICSACTEVHGGVWRTK